ncbi:uncharacterized protein LOC142007886 [Carettochelys insculpta]|uniref:uncharacterized protein LOC142007886 n=1 Tax=Carettochelys insculpta TaxID=44489 RepID=UPI003EB818BD
MGASSADGGLLGGPSGLSGVAGGGRHDAGTATFNPDNSMAPQLLVIFLTISLTSAIPKHHLRNAIQSIVSTAGATDCWMCTLLNASTRLGIEFVPLNRNDWWDKSNIFQWGPVCFDDSNIHSYLRCGPWGSCCDRILKIQILKICLQSLHQASSSEGWTTPAPPSDGAREPSSPSPRVPPAQPRRAQRHRHYDPQEAAEAHTAAIWEQIAVLQEWLQMEREDRA